MDADVGEMVVAERVSGTSAGKAKPGDAAAVAEAVEAALETCVEKLMAGMFP
jgi:hypothetical protein